MARPMTESISSPIAGTLAVPKSRVNRCGLSHHAPEQAMAQGEGAGDRIAQALKAAGLKPVDLARRLKVSQPTVHNWVNSNHGITWKNVRRVAKELKVAPGWIMFGADEEAERIASTAMELAFLRLYRELDDQDQASHLRLLTNMQHPPPDSRPANQPRGQPQPPPLPGGHVQENRASGRSPPRINGG